MSKVAPLLAWVETIGQLDGAVCARRIAEAEVHGPLAPDAERSVAEDPESAERSQSSNHRAPPVLARFAGGSLASSSNVLIASAWFAGPSRTKRRRSYYG